MINSKLPKVGATIFSTMSKLAADTGAINLSQGFPNFPIDPILQELLIEKSTEAIHQYAPMPGNTKLLENVSKLIEKSYGRKVKAESEVLITAGATQGIFTTITALIQKGDEVVILDPCYDCYEPAVILAGGKPVRIPLNDDYTPDWNLIASSINENTRMLITNNPHNPTGRVWAQGDFDNLKAIANTYQNFFILSDEVYEYITFENKHISIHEHKSLIDRAISVSSFGKTFHITGWKIGYLIAPELIMNEIKKVHQFNVFSVNSIGQAVLADYLEKIDVQKLGAFYQKKRDLFAEKMKHSRFELLPCEGTYFQTADYSKIADLNDVDFCIELTKKYGVATIPISVFNENSKDARIIRFCFAKDDETILKATELLCRI